MMHHVKIFCFALLGQFLLVLQLCAQDSLVVTRSRAQIRREQLVRTSNDSIDLLRTDTIVHLAADSIVLDFGDSTTIHVPVVELQPSDTVVNMQSAVVTGEVMTDLPSPKRFVPDPKKAMWLAIVFPGGGQIYNRKYWKLPLFYGGFLGCVYAINWNNTMYRDYSQAYIDIMDDDPNTRSYVNFLPMRYDAEANKTRLQELFRKKKDYYRRYRDMSIFVTVGVYVLSVLDAYIDAELSSFDISRDLSLKVRPSVITNDHSIAQSRRPLVNSAYGISCAFQF